MRIVSAAVAGLVLLASSPGHAQQLDSLAIVQRTQALSRLADGQRVRIRAGGIGWVDGRVVSRSPMLVTVRSESSTVEVPAARIDSLWTHGTRAGKGALIGGAVGALSFGAIAAMICPRECDASSGTAAVGAGAFGAVLGGAVGAVIGAIVPHWRLRIP